MTLGIIAAMKIEADKIIAEMKETSAEEIGGITFTSGKICETDVVCAVCGIGKVFAAMCAQTMAVKFSPDYVINTGVGGTLTNELGIGDVAVSADVVQHDMDTSAIGDPVGLISGINIIKIPASNTLSELVIKIAQEHGIKAVQGTIASGDRFIADKKTKDRIVAQFSGIACEMEGAAIGQVCYVNKIPFCIIRAISDSADGEATLDYPTFAQKAAENSADIVVRLAADINK